MANRKRIGLIYTYNENWIGGTYYIENLVNALKKLSDAQQPELIILSWEATDAERLQKAVQYPYWSFRRFQRKLSLPERAFNKITTSLLGHRYISPLYSDFDLVFPVSTGWQQYFSRIQHHLYWIPDFQEHYLPAFFKVDEIEARKAEQQCILRMARHIVFSSHAVQDDFNDIYAGNGLKQHILQFAVTSKVVSNGVDSCLIKYDIKQPYFICSNQFWKHKNYPVVLNALAKLRQVHPDVLIVFTGKEHDYRNPTYFDELVALRDELKLQAEVKFLGFIPREDQLALMQGAIAVVQPSLFEGWSTVVEDAKSLNVPLIVSSLKVHKEQLADYPSKLFFRPDSSDGLFNIMSQALAGNLPARSYAYGQDVIRFAKEFMNTVDSILHE